MNLPDEYRTGNPGTDRLIEQALIKEGNRKRVKNLMQSAIDGMKEKGKARIPVAEKEDRTYKDGTLFASKGEMERWDYLLFVQRAGEIKDLKRQVPFVLQKPFTHPQYGDIPAIIYVADYTYINLTFRKDFPNRLCAEDHKGGQLSDIYKIKKRLFLCKYTTIPFFEV